MKEEFVVQSFKEYLRNDGWNVENIIPPSNLENTEFNYIPDILASKGEDILVGEAKGSEGLREIQTAIGQASTYYYFGGNIIVIVVPEELKETAKSLIAPIVFKDSGRIGLFYVNNKGIVKEEVAYKRISLSDKLKNEGREKLSKIVFIRDLTVEELRRLIEKIYHCKKESKSGRDLYFNLSKQDKDYIFYSRITKGKLTEKSFRNALITTNNLGLTDNGKLTSLGVSFALSTSNTKKFNLKLLNLLLIQGKFLQLLREIEFIIKTKKLEFNEAIPIAIKNLKSKHLIKDTIVDIDDYISRTKANQIKWLKELGAITADEQINWTIICDALSI